jgi:hypothetical protein
MLKPNSVEDDMERAPVTLVDILPQILPVSVFQLGDT